jgi:3-phosphoinositide dependent protein kinase-1
MSINVVTETPCPRSDDSNNNDDDNIVSEDIPGITYQTNDTSRSPSPMPIKKVDSKANLQAGSEKVPSTSSSSRPMSTQRELGPSDFYFGVTLGEGAYARVVHGRMKRVNSPDFAIKIMEKAHIKKENKVKYVMMEKNILSKVSHPFIIKFHLSFQDAGYLYMCMDLAPGGELLGVINNYRDEHKKKGIPHKACDENVTKFYISELISAVGYLHDHDIYHRDLKPENILIAGNGHIKLTDFGTALLHSDDDSTRNSFVGTAEYVSPEVLGNELVTSACDYWAIGCILYQLLTGSTPFHSASEYYTFQAILDHTKGISKISYPDHVSFIARDLIDRLLDGSPETRLGNIPEQVKQHDFLSDLQWDDLLSYPPPFIPDASSYPDTSRMRDGADEDWFLDGEATPILHDKHHRESCEELQISNSNPDSLAKSPSNGGLSNRSSLSFFTRRQSSSTSSSGNNHHNSHQSHNLICNDVSCFLDADEKHVFTGIVLKRVGLFSKRRQLILSDRPRLIYFDPTTLEVKGSIPWTWEHPVKCEIVSLVVCFRSYSLPID